MEPMTPEMADAYDLAAETLDGYDAATLDAAVPDTISTGTPDEYGAAIVTRERIDQRLANYRPLEVIDAACALCVHYHADDCGCFRVSGEIRSDYVCDLYERAVLEEKANEPSVLDGGYLIAKSDDEQQIVFGWANVAVRKTGETVLDHHLDEITPEDLEDAAYDFVLNARASGEDHAGEVDASCVESIVFTLEKTRAMGIPDGVLPEAGWWVGFHIPDRDAYLRARDSKSMFSIEGTAIREPIEKAAIPSHRTPTSTDSWDGPANEARVRSSQQPDYYARVYAWRDPEADPSVKTPYRFIHHEISADGTPGAANVQALRTAIGVLNGGRGVDVSAQPWSSDRQSIYRHLAAHLRDAGLEAPPLD